MTTQDKFAKIDKTIVDKSNCRVHFGNNLNRLPLVGMFVNHIDCVDLRNKGMIRFIPSSKLENYQLTQSVYFTRILNVSDIMDVKPFVCPVLI